MSRRLEITLVSRVIRGLIISLKSSRKLVNALLIPGTTAGIVLLGGESELA